MRVLRRTGNDFKWSADKSKSEWDKDDEHHKDAMTAFAKDILQLTNVRNSYLDRETLLKMYDMYMTYDTNVVPMWKQNIQALYDKLKEQA
jgi:hypothetical protein